MIGVLYVKKSKVKKIAFILLCVFSFSSINVNAYDNINRKTKDSVKIEYIFDEEIKEIYVSEITEMSIDKHARLNLNAPLMEYPIYTRVVVTQSSSKGLIERDSKTGFYASIASISLSFSKYALAMKVSTILSVVGLIASANTYTTAKTFTSYVEYRKSGQAKWSDDPAFSTWVLSGQRNHYRHVLGATQNISGTWTTHTTDFLSEPSYVEQGNFFYYSDSWFKQQAYERLTNYSFLDDLPW